ncbi:MAG: capsule biosynthesis protein [Sphingomonas bacterium]|uniref:DUF6356 family protein n=1 Tax=Sphingomonas bacterium TaxID=1895847 RepID=UPI002629D2DF|nr:DUF6356 family protein [Sphingomonas bacterium]MDB5696104.1 capsule biosynthesis protein [Sphingomonas bacterium]
MKLFTDHPATLGETYWQHMAVAARFGARMLAGSIACFVHALLPFACKSRGSDTVRALHAELIAKRAAATQVKSVEYVI